MTLAPPVEEPVHEVVSRSSQDIVKRDGGAGLLDQALIIDSLMDQVHQQAGSGDIAKVSGDELPDFLRPAPSLPCRGYKIAFERVPDDADVADGSQLLV